MTKEKVIRILGVKMENFSEKNRHSEILFRKKISSPQTWRQVSATATLTHLITFST